MKQWTHLNVYAVGVDVTDINVGDKVYVRTSALHNAEIVDTEMESISADELENQHNLTDFQPIAPTERVEVICDPGEKVVFRYLFNGYRKELNKLRIYKLKNGNNHRFKEYVSDPDLNTIESGDWWITLLGAEPDAAIGWQGNDLEKDERYVLYFVVQDNDGNLDLDDTEGMILDPTVIGEYSGSNDSGDDSGGGGGGGSGCFINSLRFK